MDAENSSIQIELKRTYRVKEESAKDYYHGSLSDLTFSVSFYYSLVKLDQVASADYVPIRYAPYEKQYFGFLIPYTKPDPSYRYTQGTSIRYLNRFNPKNLSWITISVIRFLKLKMQSIGKQHSMQLPRSTKR